MKRIFTTFFLVFFTATTQAEIVVIGNLNGIESLSFTQVEKIFMGRSYALPNGQVANPVDQSTLRTEFYEKLTSKPIEQINAYWAQIVFKGLNFLPLLSDDKEVLTIINSNKNTIGYIDKKNVNNRVRVLLILN
ncbi:MAG: hypothetical protein LUP96_02005 [Methylococcaceae bacterium]|nr:hypothetical protein [Methylococcaceae bacterium]